MHTRNRTTRSVSVFATGLVFALGLILTPGHTSAQGTVTAMESHPAHIHSGTCATLGDVVYPLTDVSAGGMDTMGTPRSGEMMGSPAAGDMMATPTTMDAMGMGTPMGSPTAMQGETSVTIVEAALSDLTAGGYAINVHESAENIGNYIACGDISGMTAGSMDVTIQLETLNDSGYSGTAMLHDNGDGTTTVTIDLMNTMM